MNDVTLFTQITIRTSNMNKFWNNGNSGVLHTHVMYYKICDRSEVNIPQKVFSCYVSNCHKKEACKAI